MRGEAQVDSGGLPPAFLHKMQLHWSKVTKAFQAMDVAREGKLHRSNFEVLCDRVGVDLSEREMDQVINVFDRNKDGTIDYSEFCSVVGSLLQPSSVASGVSLNFNPNFRPKRPEGRAKTFSGLQTMWNNTYFQTLDERSGKPVLQNILQGKYYMERTAVRPATAMSASLPHGTLVDSELDQPLVKSLIQGEYYFKKDHLRDPNAGAVDYIAHNRRMTKEYSKLVAATRPSTAMGMMEGRHSSASGQYGGQYLNMSASLTKPARGRLAAEIPTPRTAQDLQDLWGRSLDPKFVASTLTWLNKASAVEKKHFKNAIANYPIQIMAKPVAGLSASRRVSRPQSATGSRRPPSSMQPSLGVDPEAIAAATKYARSRPDSSYSNRKQKAAEINGEYYGKRPMSASSRGRAHTPIDVGRQIKAQDVHPTIQKSTFRSSWAAPIGNA